MPTPECRNRGRAVWDGEGVGGIEDEEGGGEWDGSV